MLPVTACVTALGTAAVTTASNFESSMSQVQATMGITKDAMSNVNGQSVNTMDKANNHRVCSNRYVMEEAFRKLFIMSWNEIVKNQEDYNEHWQESLHSDDLLLRFKTKLLMKQVNKAGTLKQFNPELMLAVMDNIIVYEDGKLKIKYYDDSEFEVETE